MKINLLLCDTFPGLLQEDIPSYASMFTRLFDAVTDHSEYTIYRVEEGELPATFQQGEFYVITGSNSGAYEEKEWVVRLLDWIRRATAAQVKLSGICFGHQAIAQALGGKVEVAPQGWGIGVRTSQLCGNEGASYFPEGEMRLLYNHHDQVTRLPERAILTATSSFCLNEGFRIGDSILTFQGHPEFTPAYVRHLIIHHAPTEPAEVKERALYSLDTLTPQSETVGRWMADFAAKSTKSEV